MYVLAICYDRLFDNGSSSDSAFVCAGTISAIYSRKEQGVNYLELC